MYRQYTFSDQKQQKAKVKAKETDPTSSQIWLFPVTKLPGRYPLPSIPDPEACKQAMGAEPCIPPFPPGTPLLPGHQLSGG